MPRRWGAPRASPAVFVAGFLAVLACARAAEIGDAAAVDIDVNGPCKTPISKLCPSIQVGDGRVARCVREANRAARARKEDSPLTHECRKEVVQFFAKVATTGINPTAPHETPVEPVEGFRQECSGDITKFCSRSPSFLVMSCLKAHKAKLKASCQEKVFRVQTWQANHLDLDAPLASACKADIDGVKGCQGRTLPGTKLACLKGHRTTLSSSCRTELFRREQEEAEDIRLNMDVFTACKSEITASCKDEEFGEVMNLTKRSVADYRLDFGVRTQCEKDIDEKCSKEKELVDKLSIRELFGGSSGGFYFAEGQSGQVLRCLKTHFTQVKVPGCKDALRQVIRIQAAHAAADPILMRACFDDIGTQCNGVQPGKVHACLRKNIKKLQPGCREEELIQGVLESGDITLKPRLWHACKQAMGKFCQETAPGAAKMLQCLQDSRTKSDFPSICKSVLESDMEASSHDWRLKFGIAQGCKPEMERFCSYQMHQGGGKALSCLKDHFTNVTAPGCKSELRRYVGQGTENIRLAANNYQKCVADVEKYCSDISPGSGRVHDCLYKHRRNISESCAKEEFKNELHHSNDISTSSSVWLRCAASRKKLCPDVTLTEMWKCLEEKRNDEGMDRTCKAEVEKHMERKHSEFFLNPALVRSCTPDARNICPNKMAHASTRSWRSEGGVINCLINHRAQINNTNCKNELFKMEKQRTADIRLDPRARDNCKSDSLKFCSRVSHTGAGEERKCLSYHLKELSEACRGNVTSYIMLAAEDIRFKKELNDNCKESKARWCKDVARNQGRVITCLLDHLHDTEMEQPCRKPLEEEQEWRAKNISYNPALKANCKKDVLNLLQGQKCGSPTAEGWKITCLTKHEKDLKEPECQRSVHGVLQRQSADIRAKPGMANACSEDQKRLCSGVRPGGGRVHACLRQKAHQIRDAKCKNMTKEMQNADMHSASINYNIRKNCVNEKAAFCKEVTQSALLGCLAKHMNATAFSEGCRTSLGTADTAAALKKVPRVTSIDELVDWMKKNRSMVEKYGWVLLGGTVFFVILCGFVISYYVIKKSSFFASYNSVMPRDQPEDLEK